MVRPVTTHMDQRAQARTPSSPTVLWLDDERAVDPGLVGAKAANLALAARHGLPTLPGFVLTTAAPAGAPLPPTVLEELGAAWHRLVGGDDPSLVVRSSSTVEDSSTSSMAGQFTSILGVRGWEPFLVAVGRVLASARHPHGGDVERRPMGVLVQREVEASCGGVLFGLDPVAGDRRRIVVEVVCGSPDALVSGRATAAHLTLSRRGRLLWQTSAGPRPLRRRHRRRLARLARATEHAFGGPQDVEWALDHADRLWLLQSRAVTASGPAMGSGPILGPGPVAETFPDPLSALEVDLWVTPLRDGVAGALRVLGAVGRGRIERSPIVTSVGGRVAVDLDLFRGDRRPARWLDVLNPLPAARRLVAAWRVGRLRAALPALAEATLAQADADLVAVGDLAALDGPALLGLIDRATDELCGLHGHEILAGMLQAGDAGPSLASMAVATLAAERSAGGSDAEIVARTPVVLALVPPVIGTSPGLPATHAADGRGATSMPSLGALAAREALRLRCRWFQELTGTCAAELGRRLADAALLPGAGDVRLLTRTELRAAVDEGRVPEDLDARRESPVSPPLPTAFRLDDLGQPRALPRRDGPGAAGLGASAGRALGVVVQDPEAVRTVGSAVLVVDLLDPRLAAVLPEVVGIVSETGSALSHLAILAREARIPAVVAVPDARRRFPPGTTVVVDGSTGEVGLVEEAAR